MSNLSDKDYLNGKVNIIFEPIITNILTDKPKEPVIFYNSASIYYINAL